MKKKIKNDSVQSLRVFNQLWTFLMTDTFPWKFAISIYESDKLALLNNQWSSIPHHSFSQTHTQTTCQLQSITSHR